MFDNQKIIIILKKNIIKILLQNKKYSNQNILYLYL